MLDRSFIIRLYSFYSKQQVTGFLPAFIKEIITVTFLETAWMYRSRVPLMLCFSAPSAIVPLLFPYY